jgi:pSer/pThr/pTyr-binding forkhead associated (FHA) protein
VPLPPGQRAAVGDGTTIQVGAVKLTVAIPDAPLALPVPPADDTPPPPEPAPLAAIAAPADAEPAAKFVGAGGQVYALTETTTTFGRRSTNHFVLSGDPYVSGAHAQVVFSNGTFRLIDLGSTNGTSVNGRHLAANTPEPIKNGDEIVLGRTR